MLTNLQHYSDEDYRNAHDQEFILSATPKDLAMVVHELNNAFLETVDSVIAQKVLDPMGRFPLERFEAYSKLLKMALVNTSLQEMKPLHLQIALCTGSLMEGALQLFLLAYRHDYLKAQWKQWNDTDIDRLCNSIKGHLSELVTNKVINGEQKGKIVKLLKDDFKVRKNGKEITRIMLDELIGFCRNQKIFTQIDHTKEPPEEHDGEEYAHMESIRDCRNNIHVFINKPIPLFETVIGNVRNYCLIVLNLITRIDGLVEE